LLQRFRPVKWGASINHEPSLWQLPRPKRKCQKYNFKTFLESNQNSEMHHSRNLT
jgi:hypothetical protein